MSVDEDIVKPLKFNEHIAYVDESGDHGAASPGYPIFVLAFCIFAKDYYVNTVCPSVTRLKMKYFGHDVVVLHEREIRKRKHPYEFLVNESMRTEFMNDLTGLIENLDFKVIASVIRKDRTGPLSNGNPYHTAMMFCLERLSLELRLSEPDAAPLHLVCESRGRKEDNELELEFRRIKDGSNYKNEKMACEIKFARKGGCHAGMELADLIARPIGVKILRPRQENRAWDVIEKKIRHNEQGTIEGFGLKFYP